MTDAALKACGLSRWAGDPGRCRWCDYELSGRQRRWCGDECPKRMLENHCWQDARVAALVRDGHKCRRCPSAAGLAVHHHVEEARGRHNKSGCVHHLSGLLTLCGPCHTAEHAARREAAKPKSREEQLSWGWWDGFPLGWSKYEKANGLPLGSTKDWPAAEVEYDDGRAA